MDRQIQRKHFM